MCLLEFAHVDSDDIRFSTVESFGKRQRGFCFSNAAGAGEKEDTYWFAGIV